MAVGDRFLRWLSGKMAASRSAPALPSPEAVAAVEVRIDPPPVRAEAVTLPPAAFPRSDHNPLAPRVSTRKRREGEDDGSADTEANEGRFRSIRDGKRDLPSVARERAIEIVHRLWERDGYVRRACGFFDEYAIGAEGASIASRLEVPPQKPKPAPEPKIPGEPPAPGAAVPPPPEPRREAEEEEEDDDEAEEDPERAAAEKKKARHQDLIDRVWGDRQTNWDDLQHDLAEFIPLLGEMLFTANTSKITGMTAFGYIDPARIDAPIYDPENGRFLLGVLLKRPLGAGPPRFLPHVEALERKEFDPDSGEVVTEIPDEGKAWKVPGAGVNGGDLEVVIGRPCFYFYDRKIPAASRSISRFYALADEIAAYDDVHFGIVEGAAVRNAFGWDVTVDSQDQKVVDEQGAKIAEQIGKNGGVVAHNKQVEIEAKNPDLTPSDFSTATSEFRRSIFGKLGIPETWFSDATEAGNAATAELAAPTLRMLEKVQGLARRAIFSMTAYGVRRLAEFEAPDLVDDERTWEKFDVILPKIGGRDDARESTALATDTTTLSEAVSKKWLTNRRAAELWQGIASKRFDVELTWKDIPDDVDEGGKDPLASLFGPPGMTPPGAGGDNDDPAGKKPPPFGARVVESLRRVASRMAGAARGA